jgi:hypothetical protein
VRYLARRLPQLLAVLFAVTLLTFLSLNLLGDPLKSVLGPQYGDAKVRAQARADLHLDDPIPTRYVRWLGHAATGDLGRSYDSHESVSAILSKRIPVSLLLMLYAQLLALAIGTALGVRDGLLQAGDLRVQLGYGGRGRGHLLLHVIFPIGDLVSEGRPGKADNDQKHDCESMHSLPPEWPARPPSAWPPFGRDLTKNGDAESSRPST